MGRTYISAHFMPDSRDLPVGADALVGPRLPPSQRQREAQQNTGPAPAERGGKCIRALPGPMVSPRARVLSNPKLGTASHPPPAAWRYALARTDPPWRFFLLDRPLRSRWRLCRLRMRHTPCGCGPFSFCQEQTGSPREPSEAGRVGKGGAKGAGAVFAAGGNGVSGLCDAANGGGNVAAIAAFPAPQSGALPSQNSGSLPSPSCFFSPVVVSWYPWKPMN